MLYLVPTPIGNLDDITIRALNVLKTVDFIFAEDTRVTGSLLKKFDIKKPLDSFHSHNEHQKLEHIINILKGGSSVALASDAGTPGISDPGFILVRRAIEEGIALSCLPGATALIPALVMSGLPCDKFFFEGFLPQKKGRMTRLTYLLGLDHSFILYESPFRVIKTLKQIKELGFGDRQISVCREISKIYEENIRGTTDEVLEEIENRKQIKGEIVIIVKGI